MSRRLAAPRSRQTGEMTLTDREEFAGMTVTRIAPEDPEAVRARDDARLDGIGDGTDPLRFLGDEDA